MEKSSGSRTVCPRRLFVQRGRQACEPGSYPPEQNLRPRMEIAGTNMKRVAILLVKNLAEALQQRCIRTAENEPYWLTPNQYREHDGVSTSFQKRQAIWSHTPIAKIFTRLVW